MKFVRMNRLILASLFFLLSFVCVNVNATTYGDIETRIIQNTKMIDNANEMSSIYRDSYLDLSMKELAETNYTPLTVDQQNSLRDLANNTILEGNQNSYSASEKFEKFYDWILDNFYYYESPEKIIGLSFGNRQDNPYYLIMYEYSVNGKVRARDAGYATMLIALARTQGIPARTVKGYYNQSVRDEYSEWGYDITDSSVNHVWVEAYIDGAWKMFDSVADSYKRYDEYNNEYVDDLKSNALRGVEEEEQSEYQKKYYAPNMDDFSKTHIALKTYSGSNNVKYISNSNERNYLKAFLNIKSNGKKINSSYNTNDSSTWFVQNDSESNTNGYGRVKNIYWPSDKSLTGKLELNSFTALEFLMVHDNKLSQVNVTGASSLRKVNIKNNNITKIVVKGSKKLVLLKAEKNPAKYIEYNFNNNVRQIAIVKAEKGGTVAVNYYKYNGVYTHVLKAKADSDYNFIGWYRGSKMVSKKANFSVDRSKGFTYVAKFKKKPPAPYIKVSISRQKLWYYKNGKLKYTSSVVTGQRHLHDTSKGVFKIRGKSRNVYLIGPDYKSFVNYWMPIYGDVGLHDASWRWSFGGDIYTYNGSHGCVNLPMKTAAYIYNNVPVGTTVKIVS